MTEGIERRNPLVDSRRYADVCPSGGAMVLVIGIASLLAMVAGFVMGKWVF